MERLVTGVRTTGNLHIGNYFGAIKNFQILQDKYECFLFMADLHSLTTHPNPKDLQINIKNTLATYLACGIDPNKCTIFVQSHVPEISELYLLLNMNAYLGELQKCTTFKDTARKYPDNLNAGLLTYPVLMTADILIHKANLVPVGKDQEQHLEMARNFAKRFNRIYNVDFFPEPKAYNSENLLKILSLTSNGKMGKSEDPNGTIFLNDTEQSVHNKIMKAVTECYPTEKNSEMGTSMINLFTLLELVTDENTVNYFKQSYNECKLNYGELKKTLSKNMNDFLLPIREKITEYSNDNILNEILLDGKDKARKSASLTLKDVKQIINL